MHSSVTTQDESVYTLALCFVLASVSLALHLPIFPAFALELSSFMLLVPSRVPYASFSTPISWSHFQPDWAQTLQTHSIIFGLQRFVGKQASWTLPPPTASMKRRHLRILYVFAARILGGLWGKDEGCEEEGEGYAPFQGLHFHSQRLLLVRDTYRMLIRR